MTRRDPYRLTSHPHVVRLSTGTLFCRRCHKVVASRDELDEHQHAPRVHDGRTPLW